MKNLINARYNVYAAEAEQNSTTHVKHVTRSIYPQSSNDSAAVASFTRADVLLADE